MHKVIIIVTLFLILLYAPVRLALAEIPESNEVTAAELAASVAFSQVTFNGQAGMNAGSNNAVSGGAFAGASGIMAISQNSGAGAVVQQAITTKIDALTIGAPSSEK